MREPDRKRFLAALTLLMKAYRIELDEMDFHAWWQDLLDLPVEAVEQSCAQLRRAARASDFPARPGDVRDLAEDWIRFCEEKRRSKQLLLEDPAPADPEANRSRVELLIAHLEGKHSGRSVHGCGSCEFEQAHPRAHLHFRGNPNLTAASINWAESMDGCCAAPREGAWLDELQGASR